MKKTVSIILSIVMLIGALSGINLTAFAATDYADDPMYANVINLDSTKYTGEFTETNRQDYFRLNLNTDGRLTVTGFTYLDAYFQLYDDDMYCIASINPVGTAQNPKGDYMMYTLSAGTYYVRAYPWRDSTGKYWLKAEFEAFNNNDVEPNDTRYNAQKLDAGKTVTGAITYQDGVDFYKFSLPSAAYITYSVSCEEYRDTYLYKAEDDSYTDNIYGCNRVSTVYLEAGNYYLKVCGSSREKYYIKWNYCVDAPTGLSASQTANSVTLSWTKAQGTSGYSVERYASGKWQVIGTTSSSRFTATSLASGSDCQFRVRAYLTVGAAKYYSSCVYIKTATNPAKASLKSVKSKKSGKLTATWNKTTGSGYEIQYSKNKSFNNAMSFYSKKNSATVKNLTKKQRYYVRVRAYKSVKGEKLFGEWSKAKSVKVK